MRGFLLMVPTGRCQGQRGVLACWCRDAVLTCWSREHASAFLRPRDFLAAPFLSRGCWTRWVSSGGRAPWSQGAFLGRRWRRHPLSRIAHAGQRARQRAGRHRGAPGSADELGDASEPLLVEVIDETVVQELTRQEQCGMHVRGGAMGVGRQTSWSQRRGGGAAFPSHQGMQRQGLPLVPRRAGGSVGGRRRRTTRWPADGSHLSNVGGEGSPALSTSAACSAMEMMKQRDAERWKGSFGAPLPGMPNVGSRVPAKPSRFEH